MNKAVFVLLASMLLFSCSKFAKIQKSNDYDYKLQKADEYYTKKSYNNAQMLYEDVFPAMKGTPKFEDIYYKLSYCCFYQKDYLNAENYFKGFVEVFPSSNRAEECDYMRAYCYWKQSPIVELDQTNTAKTVGLMQSFINIHPNSSRVKDAGSIIDACRVKLEDKDYKSAELYYKMGMYKSAATAFSVLSDNYPDSQKGDGYKLMVIKSYYEYALNSIEEKQKERFEKVLNECGDFTDRYPDSKLVSEVENYKKQATSNLKKNSI